MKINPRWIKDLNVRPDTIKLLEKNIRKTLSDINQSKIFFDSLPIVMKVKVKLLSRIRLFATPWTVGNQAPLSMEFSRQEYWSGLPYPSPGDLPNLGIKSRSPALQADALPSEPPGMVIMTILIVNCLSGHQLVCLQFGL